MRAVTVGFAKGKVDKKGDRSCIFIFEGQNMYPILKIFGREISTYTVLGLIGVFIGIMTANIRAKKSDIDFAEILSLGAYGTIGALIGARVFSFITQIPEIITGIIKSELTFMLFIRRYILVGGLVFYGGLAGAVAAVYLYCRYIGLPKEKVFILFITVLPLVHVFGRIGCFLGGCCYGIELPPPFGIKVTLPLAGIENMYLFPVQLAESFFNIIIFIVLWMYTKKDKKLINVICLYGLLYAPIRFFLEFLRGDAVRGFVFFLSVSQVISLAAVIVILTILSILRINIIKRRGA